MYPRSLHRHILELRGAMTDNAIAEYLGISLQSVRAIADGRDDRISQQLNPQAMVVYAYIKTRGPTSLPAMFEALHYRYGDAARAEAMEAVRYLAVCRLIVREGHLYASTGKPWDDETILGMLVEGPRTAGELSEALGMRGDRVWKGLAELEAIGAVDTKDGRLWEVTA